jgi:hypothetical protein
MTLQSGENLNRDIFGIPPTSLGIKSHSDASAVEKSKKYYMGEGGGFSRVWTVESFMSPESPVACPSTKVL